MKRSSRNQRTLPLRIKECLWLFPSRAITTEKKALLNEAHGLSFSFFQQALEEGWVVVPSFGVGDGASGARGTVYDEPFPFFPLPSFFPFSRWWWLPLPSAA